MEHAFDTFLNVLLKLDIISDENGWDLYSSFRVEYGWYPDDEDDDYYD